MKAVKDFAGKAMSRLKSIVMTPWPISSFPNAPPQRCPERWLESAIDVRTAKTGGWKADAFDCQKAVT
jgi:hypothetical protein